MAHCRKPLSKVKITTSIIPISACYYSELRVQYRLARIYDMCILYQEKSFVIYDVQTSKQPTDSC